ncbi:endo-1,4-beta-xylanase [Nocardia sp. BMG51109]|uniref:endo-1,4-beta-xylanase n=1 Tax=Nocardia sp. BMG51109 TaxID=1056816 RepID=UPI000464A524|nr:endo-1,4-beta-xylanase [Nocardia sp. BMG51109]
MTALVRPARPPGRRIRDSLSGRMIALLASGAAFLMTASIGTPAVASGTPGQSRDELPVTRSEQTSPPNLEESESTRSLADRAGVTLGAAVDAEYLGEPEYARTLRSTFNSVTPENELKWSSIHPRRDVWDFARMDRIVEFATANGLAVKGHTLLWDQAKGGHLPQWVREITDRDELLGVVRDHMRTLFERYRGRVDRWDVVNEPLETHGTETYANHFYRVIGPDYVAEAFRIARELDGGARLFLNEGAIEYDPAKIEALERVVRKLKREGVPVDGVGLQSHLVHGAVPDGYAAMLADLRSAGVDVAVTELDIPVRDHTSDPLRTQAEAYRKVFEACLAVECHDITTWGFTDKYTWIDDFLGAGCAPLPFDARYRPKPALFAIREALNETGG